MRLTDKQPKAQGGATASPCAFTHGTSGGFQTRCNSQIGVTDEERL